MTTVLSLRATENEWKLIPEEATAKEAGLVRLRVVRSLLDLTDHKGELTSAIGRVIETTPTGPAIDSLVLAPSIHAQECSVPAATCLPLTEGTDENLALLAGLAAPTLAALRRTNFEIGAHGVILGLNLYGILLVSACRLGGGGNISALDNRGERLALAEKLGAGRVASPSEPGWPEALVQGSSRGGADVVFATLNDAGLVEFMLPKCRPEARVLLLAPMPTGAIELYNAVHSPGRTILGLKPETKTQQWAIDASRLLRLLQAGRYRLEGILGQRVKASEFSANSTVLNMSASLTVVLDWEN